MEFSTFSISIPGKKSPANRSENQDRVLCRTLDVNGSQGVLLVVADGITSCPFGGSVARWIVERHLAQDSFPFAEGQDPADSLRSYLNQLHKDFYVEFAAPGMEGFLDSGATLSVALLHHAVAACLWAGDSPIYLSRRTAVGYETELITTPDHDPHGRLRNCFGAGSPFNLRHRHLSLACGDVITITSDGLSIDEYTLSHIYQENGVSTATLEQMVHLSARGHFWDELSVVASQGQSKMNIQ